MFTATTCPACQHKFTVPEGAMGKRQTCPNCHSPFMAGKSTAEPEISMKLQPADPAGYNKTMLGDSAPPIKFNCPRCKKPLESPAIEAGTKKPCPECGQRLQVPMAPAPTAAAGPNLNKTMLTSDENAAPTAPPIKYNCPNCKRPMESPASEALSKKNCPGCGQRFQVPASSTTGGPNLSKTVLASDESRPQGGGYQAGAPAAGFANTVASTSPAAAATGDAAAFKVTPKVYMIGGIVAGGFAFLLLLACIIGFATSGSAKAEKDKYEQAIAEMKKANEEVRERAAREKEYEEQRRKFKEEQEREDRKFKQQLELIAANAALSQADKLKQEQAIKESERKWEMQKLEFEQRLKTQEAANQAALTAAQNRVQTIVVPHRGYWSWHPSYGWGYW